MTQSSAPAPFWETTPLQDMTTAQWESLCDGCGRCCLHKLRDEETDEIHYTSVACRLLDVSTCRCTDYVQRHRKVQDCITLTPEMVAGLDWLPPDCAYRRLSEGRSLPLWHPLLTGTAETVLESGASAAGRCISERKAGDLEDYLVTWPGEPAVPVTGHPQQRPAVRHVHTRKG
ncbi:hypothetical protein HK16_15045 [Acetobacter senegalensis]|uniref:UPF0260 protein HK16_15045 n=2 Tax=Acetobacter TaxID=434 RepID=A0A252EGX1_9PROT|nr:MULTISPECIES: YcgN family cysteine cluster protein [Acetobacter]ATJ89608.1 YcgN family cysteine cluster protein [Acetobacter tropicalis]OUL65731.1 hypothetical protein HK16_15045 [Acetobacter senegalensis]